MNKDFDIIEFLSGLTTYVFDKAVLKNIALQRGASEASSYEELEKKTIDLMKADMLYAAYLSPNVLASSTQQHGNYVKSIGSQTIYAEEKKRLYNMFYNIYSKYNDAKLEEIAVLGGYLDWID